MQINSAYQTQGLWDLDAIGKADSKKTNSLMDQAASGDTVDISDEARRLFSEAIHKYDNPASKPASEENADNGGEAPKGAGGAAGGGQGADESSSGDKVKELKEKIQSLKSQISSLTSGMVKNGGKDDGSMSKINSLNAQIAALEAELQAMESAG